MNDAPRAIRRFEAAGGVQEVLIAVPCIELMACIKEAKSKSQNCVKPALFMFMCSMMVHPSRSEGSS